MLSALDWITIVAALLLPFWVGGIVWLIGRLMRFPMPIYMGLTVPLALVGGAVPTGVAMRYVGRAISYEECVTNHNAQYHDNGCPEWTRRAFDQSERTGA